MRSEERHLFYNISVVLIALGFAFLHINHVSTMFENDRYFSHLSNLEREMAFRTEMGFYYYYYKVIVNAPSFDEGLREILQDNRTEYPDTINALQRFNLYPEVIIGGLYRVYDTVTKYLNIPTKQCCNIIRESGLPNVENCEGLGDPMHFYVEFVWYCAGLASATLFIYAVVLSESCIGGLLAVLNYFYNHSHCTRTQWAPPLRESFAYPFCLLQMLAVTLCLKSSMNEKSLTKIRIFIQVWFITTLTATSLVLWQLSQFFIATQTISIILLFCAGIINEKTLLIIVISQLVGLFQAAIMLFGNEFLFQSILFSLLLATVAVVLGFNNRIQRPVLRALFIIITITGITVSLKMKISQFFGSHDSHILDFLISKLTSYRNFHTMLYTCSPEFDFISFSTIIELSQTCLLPVAAWVVCVMLIMWRKDLTNLLWRQKPIGPQRNIDPEVAYNVLQLGAFTVMTVLVMRMKVFWSPHLCLITSLVLAPRYVSLRTSVRYSILIGLIATMSYQGVRNIRKERNTMGDYENVPFELVLNWINSSTLQTDVFAGPMPTMANVLLSTGRRIVNHPHYEHQKMRERTMKVYSIFSRRKSEEVYSTLSQMGVDYVVLEDTWCFPLRKENCNMVDLWDLVDPENRNGESLCPKLFLGDPSPFFKAFANNMFVILSLKKKHFIQITPSRIFETQVEGA